MMRFVVIFCLLTLAGVAYAYQPVLPTFSLADDSSGEGYGPPRYAGVLYEQPFSPYKVHMWGWPSGWDYGHGGGYYQADNFSIEGNLSWNIEDFHWGGFQYGYETGFESVDIEIYADAGGLPGATVMRWDFAVGDPEVTIGTWTWDHWYPAYWISVDLGYSFILEPGDYWLQLSADGTNGNPFNWFSTDLGPDASHAQDSSFNGSGDWSLQDDDLYFAITGRVRTEWQRWQIRIGIGGNTYQGGGNDLGGRFGAVTGAMDGFDSKDAVHPPPMDPTHDLTWSFQDYLTEGGRGYPQPWGLLKDMKEPFDSGYKFWELTLYAPNDPAEHTFFVQWTVGLEGYMVADPWVARLDMDGSSGGSVDLGEYELDLLENYTGGMDETFQTEPMAQFGFGNEQTWYLIAGIPEPAIAQFAGLILGLGGLGLARFRK